MLQLPTITEHPFKSIFRKHNVRIWQIKKMMPDLPSEATISRLLRGVDPMPAEIEQQLQRIIEQIESKHPARSATE